MMIELHGYVGGRVVVAPAWILGIGENRDASNELDGTILYFAGSHRVRVKESIDEVLKKLDPRDHPYRDEPIAGEVRTVAELHVQDEIAALRAKLKRLADAAHGVRTCAKQNREQSVTHAQLHDQIDELSAVLSEIGE
jgi:hypothetical protein